MSAVTSSALQLAEVHEQLEVLRGLVGRLEPEAVPLPEAPPMWQAFDAVERLAAGAKTLLAARVDASGAARRAGDRGTPEYLARTSGTSPGAARGALETSKRLAELPETRAAVRRGELSRQQAEEIAHTASKNPASERKMLNTAKRSSLSELRREGARRRAEADPDPEATRRRLHKERHRIPWTEVHETALHNTDRFCDHHHDLKTRFGWALVAGTGKREMVPPDEPRHPDNQPDPSRDRAPPDGDDSDPA